MSLLLHHSQCWPFNEDDQLLKPFFSTLTAILSGRLNRAAAFVYLLFSRIPAIDAIANPSVLATKALVDCKQGTYVSSLIKLITTPYLEGSTSQT